MKHLHYILILLIVTSGFSQEQTKDDPKVGLVLSGGGAKGLAHIGALKAIEEAGVRIDYIGGTSMGAIIGALYASGYSATQLDSIFRVVDFDQLIQDEIPRGAKTFYEKETSERYALTLPFDKFKLSFPSGLSKGQNVYNLISSLTSHVDSISDFTKLPIPFFCIATNVETGKQVLLDEGYLPRTLIASGALPTIFSPVQIGDELLIDGGVINNYPVDEILARGADVVIGVDVQDDLRRRDKLRSAFDVLVQVNNYRTIADMVAKREKTDIYIQPNITDFTVVSFSEGKEIVKAGEDQAKLYDFQLRALAARQLPSEKLKVQPANRKTLTIDEVNIDGLENYSRAYVLGKLKLKTPDEVSVKRFNEGVNNLSATGNFQEIDYRLYEKQNRVDFFIREGSSRTSLRFAAHYDDLYRTGILVNVTRKRFFTNNDIASLDVIVGDNVRYNFNYFIDKGYYWSIGFNSSFNFFRKDIPIEVIIPEVATTNPTQVNKLELNYSDFTNQLYFVTLFRRSFQLGLGVEHKYLRFISETIGFDENLNPRTIFESTNYFSGYGYLKYDTYDNSFFPNSGLYFAGDFHLYAFAEGRNEDFDQFSIAKAKAGYATSFLQKFSAQLTTEGGFKIGPDGTKSLDFFLGGYGYAPINNIIPFLGYEALRLRGNTYLKSSLSLDYEIFRKNHITLSANIANVGDDLFETGEWINEIDYSGFALGYGLETIVGPIEVKYAYSPERKDGEWYVTAGFRF